MTRPNDGEVFRFREVKDDEDLDNWEDLKAKPIRTEKGIIESIARRKATNPDDSAIETLERQLVDMRAGRSQDDSGASGQSQSGNKYFKLPDDQDASEKREKVVGKFFTIPGSEE